MTAEASDLYELNVLGSRVLSPGFVRVTGRTEPGRTVPCAGHDQWLRLFFPDSPEVPLTLPHGPAEGWFARYRAMDEAVRPVCRNYTVREAREGGAEIDIDFVVHRAPDGELVGAAAAWALAARPGDRLGVLPQATICEPEAMQGHVVVIADPSGLPAAEGIAAALPPIHADFFLQIDDPADVRPLPSAAELEVSWLAPGAEPELALGDRDTSYVYLVGGKQFIEAMRARLAPLRLSETGPEDAGAASGRLIRSCVYWR